MQIEKLVEAVGPVAVHHPRRGVRITGLTSDSRLVQPGFLFAALPGLKIDGAAFARDVFERGAAVILSERPEALTPLPQLVVKDARAGLARAARAFYGLPDRELRIGAITGTNGKSTTAFLVRHLLKKAGCACGLLGTIEYDLGSEILPAPLTTPEPVELFQALRRMAQAGCSTAIMEVSSHSLAQHRVDGVRYSAAAFTNLTQDHLDFHRTMEAYRDAKGRLFQELGPEAVAVINRDDPVGEHFAKLTQAQVLGCSLRGHPKADLQARITEMDIHGTSFEFASPWGRRKLRWRLVGEHNVQNALTALGTALALGDGGRGTFNFDSALGALEAFIGVPGRLEPVADGLAPFRVLVDYAHTDDALRNVMQAMRDLKPSRLIVVFGCGGDRDRSKRPKMGHSVEEMADLGVVTSDNPRTEDPAAIVGEIWSGIQRRSKFMVEVDRAKAIQMAVREARVGDVVLITGKGHEDYQIIGTEKRHFDDREIARAAMEIRYGKSAQAGPITHAAG